MDLPRVLGIIAQLEVPWHLAKVYGNLQQTPHCQLSEIARSLSLQCVDEEASDSTENKMLYSNDSSFDLAPRYISLI